MERRRVFPPCDAWLFGLIDDSRHVGILPQTGKRGEAEHDDEYGHKNRDDARDEADDAGDVTCCVHAVFLKAVRFRKPAVGAAHGQAHDGEHEADDGKPGHDKAHDAEHHRGDGLLVMRLLFGG